MHSMLEEILAHKRKEIEGVREGGLPRDVEGPIPPVRDFKAALSGKGGMTVIAEMKLASPSAGVIRDRGDPVSIARIYEEAGAGAVSVLTDRRFFHGDIRFTPLIRRAISLPVLRKDFILDPIQVEESVRYGADAILLIAGILGLNTVNIHDAISRVTPFAVDVNSGIEQWPGKKDPVLLKRLMEKIAVGDKGRNMHE